MPPPASVIANADSTSLMKDDPVPCPPSSSPPTAEHLFSLVPGLFTGSLYPALIASAWLLWTVVVPLAVLLPLSFSSHTWALRATLLSMIGTGLLVLILLTLPLPRTLLSLWGTAPASSPPLAHTSTPPSSHTVHVSHALLIVNPTGGTRDNRALHGRIILPFLTSHRIQCTTHFTEYSGHARQLAHSLDLSPYQCIVVVGGDGSLHEVANGLMTRVDAVKLPIALIPLGTGNAVGTDLGTLDVETALQRVVAGEVSYIDLNHLTSPSTLCPLSLYSVETITWGLIGTVAVQAELPSMRRLGHLRFDLCAVLNVLKGFQAELQFRSPSLSLKGPFVTVYLNNTQYFARLLRAAPKAVLDDGKMDVLMLERGSRSLLLGLFLLLATGAHVGGEGVRYLQEEEVWMRPGEGRGVINVDGEIVEFEGEIRVRCLRKALPILMEAEWKGRRIPELKERPA
jgi:diacylglycerol kinase family enzyme